MIYDEVEVQPLSDKTILIESTEGEPKNILFLMYSQLPISYLYNLSGNGITLKDGVSSPHLSLPFLIQYKAPFKKSTLTLYIKNLDNKISSKFNLLVLFLD